MSTPRFVDYGSLMTPPAPFRSLETELWGFWVDADADRLDALCAKVFTVPSGGAVDVRALGNNILLTWGFIEDVLPTTPPYDGMGSVREPQVAIWIPTATVERKKRVLIAKEFAMFVPYIWLDNAMSLATGRELFGYPKAWGWPEVTGGNGSPRRYKLDAFGLDYGAGAQADRRPLLEVVEGDTLDRDEGPLEDLADIARSVASELFERDEGGFVLPGLDFTEGLVEDLRERSFRGIFLKQFRSVEDGLSASQQQIVDVRYEVTRVRATPALREHTLTVHPLDSHPVATELGLESQVTRLAFRVEMDFNVGDGHVLWDAANPPPANR